MGTFGSANPMGAFSQYAQYGQPQPRNAFLANPSPSASQPSYWQGIAQQSGTPAQSQAAAPMSAPASNPASMSITQLQQMFPNINPAYFASYLHSQPVTSVDLGYFDRLNLNKGGNIPQNVNTSNGLTDATTGQSIMQGISPLQALMTAQNPQGIASTAAAVPQMAVRPTGPMASQFQGIMAPQTMPIRNPFLFF